MPTCKNIKQMRSKETQDCDPEPERYYDWMLWALRQKRKTVTKMSHIKTFLKKIPKWLILNKTFFKLIKKTLYICIFMWYNSTIKW